MAKKVHTLHTRDLFPPTTTLTTTLTPTRTPTPTTTPPTTKLDKFQTAVSSFSLTSSLDQNGAIVMCD